jgi:hypothetical protein
MNKNLITSDMKNGVKPYTVDALVDVITVDDDKDDISDLSKYFVDLINNDKLEPGKFAEIKIEIPMKCQIVNSLPVLPGEFWANQKPTMENVISYIAVNGSRYSNSRALNLPFKGSKTFFDFIVRAGFQSVVLSMCDILVKQVVNSNDLVFFCGFIQTLKTDLAAFSKDDQSDVTGVVAVAERFCKPQNAITDYQDQKNAKTEFAKSLTTVQNTLLSMRKPGAVFSPNPMFSYVYHFDSEMTAFNDSKVANPSVWFFNWVAAMYLNNYKNEDVLLTMLCIGCNAYQNVDSIEFKGRVGNSEYVIALQSIRLIVAKSSDMRHSSDANRAYAGFLTLGLHKKLTKFEPSCYIENSKIWFAAHRYPGADNDEITVPARALMNAQKNIYEIGSVASVQGLIKTLNKIHGKSKIELLFKNDVAYKVAIETSNMTNKRGQKGDSRQIDIIGKVRQRMLDGLLENVGSMSGRILEGSGLLKKLQDSLSESEIK